MQVKTTYKAFAILWVITLMMAISVNSVRYFAGDDDGAIAVALTEEEDQDEGQDSSQDSEEEGDSTGKEKSSESFAVCNDFDFQFIAEHESGQLKAPVPVQSVIHVSLAIIAPPPEA